MKNLYLLRHADAELLAQQDKDRQLSEAGHTEAEAVAKVFAEKAIVLDAILCSSAIRTRQTCAHFLQLLNGKPAPQYLEELYNTDLETYLEVLKGLDGSYNAVLLIGHNPVITELASYLTGQPCHFSTGVLKYLELDVKSWAKVLSPCAKVVWSIPQ
jgi:phosphohistidine phosphatase